MDKDLVVDFQTVEDFISNFFKSPYIAGWLGVFIPQIYDLREYALTNPFSVSTKFLKLLFPENLPELYEKDRDEIINVEDVPRLVHYTLIQIEAIENFFRKKEESFYLELIFQLPFLWNSRFDRRTRQSFIKSKKDKYYSTFRQNLRGSIIITTEDIPLRDNKLVRQVFIKNSLDSKIKNYLLTPPVLTAYWDFCIKKTISNHLISPSPR